MRSMWWEAVEVEVLEHGVWREGWLNREDWRKAPDGRTWEATVHYSRGPGQNYVATFHQSQIRKVESVEG